jgi:hypothetical protein
MYVYSGLMIMGTISDVKSLDEVVKWLVKAGALHAYLPVRVKVRSWKLRKTDNEKSILFIYVYDRFFRMEAICFDSELAKCHALKLGSIQPNDDIIIAGVLEFSGSSHDAWIDDKGFTSCVQEYAKIDDSNFASPYEIERLRYEKSGGKLKPEYSTVRMRIYYLKVDSENDICVGLNEV